MCTDAYREALTQALGPRVQLGDPPEAAAGLPRGSGYEQAQAGFRGVESETGRDEEMGTGNVTSRELAGLVERMAEAASAFIRGDIRRYLSLIRHADDYTLMAPSGGEPRRGFDNSDPAAAALAEYFRGPGEAELQVFEAYTSGDLVVLVAVERQHGEVGGLPDQDWSLRVTLVFRREGQGWKLAHRHADPLVHEITADQLASLARG
jgi:ketosteroid isomerase-like protein